MCHSNLQLRQVKEATLFLRECVCLMSVFVFDGSLFFMKVSPRCDGNFEKNNTKKAWYIFFPCLTSF